MGKQKVNSIFCCKCRKNFDVNTEDIRWTELSDMGECEVELGTKQMGLLQDVTCPYCGKINRIAFEQHILPNGDISFMEAKSLDV